MWTRPSRCKKQKDVVEKIRSVQKRRKTLIVAHKGYENNVSSENCKKSKHRKYWSHFNELTEVNDLLIMFSCAFKAVYRLATKKFLPGYTRNVWKVAWMENICSLLKLERAKVKRCKKRFQNVGQIIRQASKWMKICPKKWNLRKKDEGAKEEKSFLSGSITALEIHECYTEPIMNKVRRQVGFGKRFPCLKSLYACISYWKKIFTEISSETI